MHHDGVLVHQLAGGVAERRQRQRDALHFTLVNLLLVLLLQVFPPAFRQKPKYTRGVSAAAWGESLSKADREEKKGLCSLR